VLFLHVTSKIPDRPDDDLLTRMGGRAFPTLMYLDASGNQIGAPMGRSVAAFERDLAAATSRAQQADADHKERRARAQTLLAKLRFKALKGAAGVKEYLDHRADLTDDERHRVELYFARQELEAAVPLAAGQPLDSPACAQGVLGILTAHAKMGGALPADDLGVEACLALLRWAEAKKDPLLFYQWHTAFVALYPQVESDEATVEATLGRQQARLDAMLGR